MLTNATVQSVEGDIVLIAHAAAPLARRLAESRNVDLITLALRNVVGGNWKVKCVHAGAAPAPQQASAPPPPPAPQRPAPTRQVEAPQRQASRPGTDHDDIPPPPEPPEPDDPLPPPFPPAQPKSAEEEEEEMLAEASQKPSDGERVVARDPEEVAIELLAQELGARKIGPAS
jgi:DNA polymerase III subunit gamma/tau